MHARRIIAVSPDPAFGAQLAAALHDAGHGASVETFHRVAELGTGDLDATVAAIHFDGEVMAAASAILARLGTNCRVIAVIQRSNLSAIVKLMETSLRVSAMMVAEDLDVARLSALASRLLTGEIFGLDKVMEVGTPIHSEVIGDFAQKAECMQRIAAFVERDVPRGFHEAIEQCADEMLVNALYDAPMDQKGKPVFAGISARARIAISIDQEVVVQYAYDGRQFAIGVRDAFGALERATVMRVLYKCLHATQKIDRKISGAGVGLYLMVASATRVFFNVIPSVATEVVCTFDVTKPAELTQLGFITERTDVTGALVAAKRLPPGTVKPPPEPLSRYAKLGRAAIALAVVVAIGLVATAAIRRALQAPSTADLTVDTHLAATVEIDGRVVGTAADTLTIRDLEIGRAYVIVAKLDGYQPKRVVVQVHAGNNAVTLDLERLPATVELDTDPSGASVEIGGVAMGQTPLTLTSLAAKTTVAIHFKKPGYTDATEQVAVPASGASVKVVHKLVASDAFVRVHFVSTPPGAQVIHDGVIPAAADRAYTPVDVVVAVGTVQRFMLIMPSHVPLVIEPFTPVRGNGVIEKGGTLVEGATVHIEAANRGVIKVSGAPHCTNVTPPVDCVLAPGSYTIELAGGNGAVQSRSITVFREDSTVRF